MTIFNKNSPKITMAKLSGIKYNLDTISICTTNVDTAITISMKNIAWKILEYR